MVLSNNYYESKVQHLIDRSSFKEIDIDYSNNFKEKINLWISKWTLEEEIDNK